MFFCRHEHIIIIIFVFAYFFIISRIIIRPITQTFVACFQRFHVNIHLNSLDIDCSVKFYDFGFFSKGVNPKF